MHYLYFILALVLNSKKQVYNCKTSDLGVMHNEQTNPCCLQLINTLINTVFYKLCTFLANKEEQGKPMMVKRKLDGAVDQYISKSDVIAYTL